MWLYGTPEPHMVCWYQYCIYFVVLVSAATSRIGMTAC